MFDILFHFFLVHETITISESDDDESISKNASCEDTEENEVAPKPAVTEESTAVSALNFFK